MPIGGPEDARRREGRWANLLPDVLEGAEGRVTGATCVQGRAEIQETAEHIVVEASDLRRLLCALPRLAGQPVVEVDFLSVVDDAQVARNRPSLEVLARGSLDGQPVGIQLDHIAAIVMKIAAAIGGNVRRIDGLDLQVDWLAPGARGCCACTTCRRLLHGK